MTRCQIINVLMIYQAFMLVAVYPWDLGGENVYNTVLVKIKLIKIPRRKNIAL